MKIPDIVKRSAYAIGGSFLIKKAFGNSLESRKKNMAITLAHDYIENCDGHEIWGKPHLNIPPEIEEKWKEFYDERDDIPQIGVIASEYEIAQAILASAGIRISIDELKDRWDQ